VLLAYLALSPKGSQQRRKLATCCGAMRPTRRARQFAHLCLGLAQSAWRYRAWGHCSDGEDIALGRRAFDTDAVDFRLLAAQSGRTELEEAAKSLLGELLDGLAIENDEFESWRRTETTRYRDQPSMF